MKKKIYTAPYTDIVFLYVKDNVMIEVVPGHNTSQQLSNGLSCGFEEDEDEEDDGGNGYGSLHEGNSGLWYD